MQTYFVVDDIEYIHPDTSLGRFSVYVRPMIQILNGDQRLCPMTVVNNRPKDGLMDSEIDENFVSYYWSNNCL